MTRTADELFDEAERAEDRGEGERARQLYEAVARLEDDELSSLAMIQLAVLSEKADDLPAAEKWYRSTIGSDQPSDRLLAKLHLGEILLERGRTKLGRTLLQEVAATSTDPSFAASALVDLAMASEQADDEASARELYRMAIASGDRNAAPKAMVLLGLLLQEAGDPEGASKLYRQAMSSGHRVWADEARSAYETLPPVPPPSASGR